MALPVARGTQRAVEAQAARAGVSVDAYLRHILLRDSLDRHADWSARHPGLDEWAAHESEAAHAESELP